MTKIITFIKSRGRKQYTSYFLQYQILKAQKRINHGENWYQVKQSILASVNRYCNFHILFIYYVLYFALGTFTLYFPCFPSFLLIALKSRYCSFKLLILVLKKADHRSVKSTSCNS